MKTIELRRHSYKGIHATKGMLSPRGIEHAHRVGVEEMRGKTYTHASVTPYTRTLQTLAAFIDGGELVIPTFVQEKRILSPRMAEWVEIFSTIGEDIGAIREAHPEFVAEEAASLGGVLNSIAGELPDGANMLLIAHSPLIEVMVLGVIGEQLKPIAPLEGAVINWSDAGKPLLLREIRY